MSLGKKDKLFTGRKFLKMTSRPGFFNSEKTRASFQMSGKSPDCNELLTIFVRTRKEEILTFANQCGWHRVKRAGFNYSCNQNLNPQMYFWWRWSAGFLKLYGKVIKISKICPHSWHACFLPPGMNGISPEVLGVEFKVHLIPEVITWIQISEAHRKTFARFVKTQVIPYQLRDFSIPLGAWSQLSTGRVFSGRYK